MLCVPFSCRQGLGICMPEGHGCNAGPQSSGARLRRDKVKKPSTPALSQKAASQAWRAWEDMGEADRTPRASHLFPRASTIRNKNPQLLWVRCYS